MLFGKTRKKAGEVFRVLCRQKGVEILEGNAMVDYIHGVEHPSQIQYGDVGWLFEREVSYTDSLRDVGSKKGFTGKSFWSRGHCASAAGLDEKMVREYMKNQHEHDKRQDGLGFD